MTEPTGYVITVGIDAPDIVHLNPTPESACGGRKWHEEDPTIEGSDIAYQTVDEDTALAMIDRGSAIPCRRCEMKDHPAVDWSIYGPQEGLG